MKPIDRATAAELDGRYDEAADAYIDALDEADLAPDDRGHILTKLASLYRLAGQWEDAESTALEAVELAAKGSSPAAEARAHMILGTVLLAMCQEDIPPAADVEDVLQQAVSAVGHAANLFEHLGVIEFYSALLTIAVAMRLAADNGSARGVFGRIVRDLSDARWSQPATAAHADHLRGRAFMGLGEIALDEGDDDTGREHLEAAAALLLASGGEEPAGVALVDDIADLVEGRLEDPDRAAELRQEASALER